MNRALQILSVACVLLFAGCQANKKAKNLAKWPKGVTYEIFVQSFADSDGDGKGDFNGMTEKLPYLEDLGVDAVWLMPIMASPSYHKYDVTDYEAVHPDYGTMDDFKRFVAEAHKRNIKVVIDFIINHSSNQHKWFLEAKKSKDNPYRGFYEWKTLKQIKEEGSMTKEAHADSGNIYQWYDSKEDGVDEYYYGYFGSQMPDINYDNKQVKQEIFRIGQFWLKDVGVDGFRLDAAKHIYDYAPEKSHKFWVEFKEAMQQVKPDVYLVGEVWADAQTVAPYLKGLPALFNFDMGNAIADACKNQKNNGLVANYKKINDFYKSVTPDFVDATFTTNHDQERIMSVLGNDTEKAKMAGALLMTLPGSPYVYYGEEIGMRGRKPDEFIREPILWDENKQQEATWIAPKYTTHETVKPANVQAKDKGSMLNHYKMLIHKRKESNALSMGNLEEIKLENSAVVAFYRAYQDQKQMVLHNLSDKAVTVPLDNSAYQKQYMSTKEGVKVNTGEVTLPAYTSVVLEK
ncbi:MAG: alpha-amylase family glycosyl hydrolase [Cytophagales bacterium]|nr:alpha-amylase family glycosyl hydrolase [Cytophagales bacterium]